MCGDVILSVCAIVLGILLVAAIVQLMRTPAKNHHANTLPDNSLSSNNLAARIDLLIAKSPEDSIVRSLLIARKNYLLQTAHASASPFDITQIVTEKEEQVFSKFAKSFKKRIDTQNIWIISNAHSSSVIKSKAKLSFGSVEYIKCAFQVPIISTDIMEVAFFPCFIVISLNDGQIILKQWWDFETSTNDIEIKEFEKDLEGGVYTLVRKELNPNHKKKWDGTYTAPKFYCVIKYTCVDININDVVIAFANKQYAMDLNDIIQEAHQQLITKYQYIPKDYYLGALSHVKNLYNYIHSICIPNLVKYIENQKLQNVTGESLSCKNLMERLTISDVFTALRTVKGDNFSLLEKEGICVVLLASGRIKGDVTFDEYMSITDSEINSIASSIESAEHTFPRAKNDISLAALLLEKYDPDTALQYLIYMYRLLSIALKTDTNIRQAEQYLQQIIAYAKRIDNNVDMSKDVVDTYDVRIEFGDKFLVGQYVVREQKCVISDIHAGLEISRDRILIALKALETAGVVQTNGTKRIVLIKNENDVIRLLRGQSAKRL